MSPKQLVFGGVGVVATGLAVAGVWLPGLPTTPLVLVALWSFSRTSERMTAWLRRIPVLKQANAAADRYLVERTLPLWVKIVAQTAAWTSTVGVFVVTQSWVTIPVALAAVGCSVFMALTPTRRATAPEPVSPEAPR